MSSLNDELIFYFICPKLMIFSRQCLEKLLNKLWYTHNMEYYAAIKSGRYTYTDTPYC